MTVSPAIVQICAICAGGHGCPGFGDTAMTQASAIMLVLEDGLTSIFVRCLLTALIL
jgi:hypothetical protein